jgi:uncharacterized small protein (DUF1192 family)
VRTLIDLTDEASPAGYDPLPDPSSICLDGDDVVLMLRETELRMSYMQFFELVDKCNSWIFDDMRGEKDLSGDDEQCSAAEHQRLREIVGEIVNDGAVGDVEVSDPLRQAVRLSVTSLEQVNADLRADVERLRAQLDMLRLRRRKAKVDQ